MPNHVFKILAEQCFQVPFTDISSTELSSADVCLQKCIGSWQYFRQLTGLNPVMFGITVTFGGFFALKTILFTVSQVYSLMYCGCFIFGLVKVAEFLSNQAVVINLVNLLEVKAKGFFLYLYLTHSGLTVEDAINGNELSAKSVFEIARDKESFTGVINWINGHEKRR